MKRHIKRINAPKTWKISRKGNKFIKRPNPGAHSFMLGVSLLTLFKEIDTLAKTGREVKAILNNQEIFVNGKKISNPDFLVGFMDVISIPKIGYYKRIMINSKGFLMTEDIDEKSASQRMLKLVGKSLVKGKMQLNFLDGTNILADKKEEHNIGDTKIIDIKTKKIIKTLKLEKGAIIMLYVGKKIGLKAKISGIKEKILFLEKDGREFETIKDYAFVIG